MSAPTPSREADDVRERYARRDGVRDAHRYSLSDPYALAAWQERQRKLLRLLCGAGLDDFAQLDVLDVGCGGGGHLLDLLRLGVTPQRLQGIELLAERAQAARTVLPTACRIWNADALDPQMESSLPVASQDIVVLFTVFSSILSDAVQQQLAARVWQWLRPGGAVLWHDFVYDNPRNPDVRAVPLKRLRELFPEARIEARRITLAPPLGRAACRVSPALYPLLNAVPLLRTHVLCLLSKPL
ncbi:methyltransferase domain-containing protein [Diaphorobacter aerolatus]|uniref:Methyltransferase domain-containing protein n=1 Tax=Diaphorobacter aerolatus TaxID=1288495 RepID=A0A7H0GI82_9BURK|nr:methyltransferase domain-containing protein [Diaphorobacter aerolatus]QNP47998.1 methyltransferase domain-containing protein [Diaphorobacter aerolatus]